MDPRGAMELPITGSNTAVKLPITGICVLYSHVFCTLDLALPSFRVLILTSDILCFVRRQV